MWPSSVFIFQREWLSSIYPSVVMIFVDGMFLLLLLQFLSSLSFLPYKRKNNIEQLWNITWKKSLHLAPVYISIVAEDCETKIKRNVVWKWSIVIVIIVIITLMKAAYIVLTHFTPISHFYTFGFLRFSGGIEIGHWREKGLNHAKPVFPF